MRSITKITVFGVRLALVVLAAYWLVIFVGTHMPRLPHAVPRFNDKLLHFTAYFVLTTLMCYTTNSTRWFRRFAVIGVTAMIYGAIDEATQAFVPRRSPELNDFLADAAGIWTAILLYVTAKLIYQQALSPAARTPNQNQHV